MNPTPVQAGTAGGLATALYLALAALMIASAWKIFAKAGKPGWAALVPIYNLLVVLDIIGKPRWWILLFLVPLLNLFVAFMIVADLATRFDKGFGFILGMVFLPFVFYPLLAFSDAPYHPPRGTLATESRRAG